MNKIDEINRAKGLLTQALAAALNSMPNNRSIQEARMHMKRALNELDNAAKTQVRKKGDTQEQYKQWWQNVNTGVAAAAHSPMTQESQHRSLQQLNAMIAEEQKKLDDLEKASVEPDPIIDLLRD